MAGNRIVADSTPFSQRQAVSLLLRNGVIPPPIEADVWNDWPVPHPLEFVLTKDAGLDSASSGGTTSSHKLPVAAGILSAFLSLSAPSGSCDGK